ncbi:beta-1,6-N-acetylglucosaminyltransferase [Kaistella anthropi]|nr:beta-1,6-N-acetylglucosaminyltransferase [Kaistella anthropi]
MKGKIKLSYLKFLLKNKDEEFSLALKPFRGSNWWSMNYDTVEKIITFYKDKKDKFDKFYSYTLCADEYFFQTMITHLAHQDKKIKILPSQTYANWSRKQKILPVTFNKDDFGS